MIDIQDKSKCCGCGACKDICPKQCIKMQSDAEGFLYPVVDKSTCIHCNLCLNVCPIHKEKDTKNEPQLFAIKHQHERIRKSSSSGGIFTLFATWILKQNGVVFGAAFDENFKVFHRYIDKQEDIHILQGSKYVQSDLKNVYKEVQNFLIEGRWVLFSGTPCQVEGLRSFLKHPYEKLLTQDFICHGVPSPLVWEKYKEYRKKDVRNGEIINISFRDKRLGWKNYSVSFLFDDGKEYSQCFYNDKYMRVFLNNLCLRPSCYSCAFKKSDRNSDITLADFWGIEQIMSKLDDDKGTSLLFIHSKKAREIFFEVCCDTIYEEVPIEQIIPHNPCLIQSVEKPRTRDLFMERIQDGGFQKVFNQHYRVSIFKRIKRKLARIKRLLWKK